MTFSLRFQDPGSESANLLELLLTSAADADRGGGAFAFSSVGGIRLLLTDEDFKSFLERAEFDLVVGVDAVTVPAGLELLLDAQTAYRGLRARAFLHRSPGALFHPKICWFSTANVGRLLVGSGNLTRGGLLNNWEALGDATVQDAELAAIQSAWGDWLDLNQDNLRELTAVPLTPRELHCQLR